MKRVVQTQKLLAIAIAASASVACTTPEPSPTPAKEPAPPPVTVQAPPPPVPSPAAARTPPPDTSVNPKLLELRVELLNAGREKALADEAKFRPLCDADGYPLVGNLVSKSAEPMFGPTAFCASVREKKAKRT